MTLGETIRAARLARGWNQRDFARSLDVSPSYISSVEHGRETPSREILSEMALRLGLAESDLLMLAGRLSERAERYAREHPIVWKFIEKSAALDASDGDIENLIGSWP